jgi:biofilm PGA synthesis N-glycosyltransferase PgaC
MTVSQLSNYVIVTPARNEAEYIELTIKSMVAQTHRPVLWVIVSDGSTDATDDIVERYSAEYQWIALLRMPERRERHFAGKVHAFNAGYESAKRCDFRVIGNVDADVSFDPDHFEFLIDQMDRDGMLGVVGAAFREGTFQYDYRLQSIENVWGGCQLFRPECFEAIGGYLPLKGGCIDHVAVVSARHRGWKTRTFTDRICLHHRKMGTALQGTLAARFRFGMKDYSVGNHPIWEVARAFYQMTQRPYVVGGVAIGCGYAWSLLRGAEIPLSSGLVKFVRREQLRRLARFVTGRPQVIVK